jgi:hypothetical protein
MMHAGGSGVAGLYRENGGRSGFAEISKPEAIRRVQDGWTNERAEFPSEPVVAGTRLRSHPGPSGYRRRNPATGPAQGIVFEPYSKNLKQSLFTGS